LLKEVDLLEFLNCRWNDRFKVATSEMKNTDDGVDMLDTGDQLRVTNCVNNSRVTTTRDHYQSFSLHMDDRTLVIHDQRIRLPAIIPPGVMDREAFFKFSPAGDFPRHEDHSIHQH